VGRLGDSAGGGGADRRRLLEYWNLRFEFRGCFGPLCDRQDRRPQHTHLDFDLHAIPQPDGHAHTDAHADGNPHAYLYANRHPYSHSYIHADGHLHANAYAHLYAYVYSHPHAHPPSPNARWCPPPGTRAYPDVPSYRRSDARC
jgi:hypothetical protein